MKSKLVTLGEKNVRVDDNTHNDLTDLCRKNETYNDVIKRLIKYYRDHKQDRH